MKFKFAVVTVMIMLFLTACSLDHLKASFHKPIEMITAKFNHDGQNDKITPNKNESSDVSSKDHKNQTQPKDNHLPGTSDKQPQNQNKESSVLTLDAKYFNQLQNVNGQLTIMNPENILVMVNKDVALPNNYRPVDLVRPNVIFSFGNQNLEKGLLRKTAAIALEDMFSEAKKAGVDLVAASGFRSYQTQTYLFNREIQQVGRDKAEQAVAKPGTSEHQTGLAMDITATSMKFGLDESFENKPEGKWLKENAYRFGYIMRYPKGKEAITKYEYEPWHYRYVGVEIATKIYKNNWTLEEYLNKVKKV